MKIIAETKIGSREKYYNYHNNGVAGILLIKIVLYVDIVVVYFSLILCAIMKL